MRNSLYFLKKYPALQISTLAVLTAVSLDKAKSEIDQLIQSGTVREIRLKGLNKPYYRVV